ncbi:MAG TPA: stimulus-sensing domain-containing protein [Stellaceae bacterium]|nr:stimulus-sensing domain-containing protein [Stellaceae bacterium]
MASVTVTETTESATPAERVLQPEPPQASAPARRRARRRLSPLTRRILAVNVLALGLLGLGLLYLGEYQQSLVSAQIDALKTQGQIFAAALGEGAVIDSLGEGQQLLPALGREMMQRLVEPTHTRARLFDANGQLIADSRILGGPGGLVQIHELPPPDEGGLLRRLVNGAYDWLVERLPGEHHYPVYHEPAAQSAADYQEVETALGGDIASAVRGERAHGGLLVLSVAVPVQRYKQVLGVVLLSNDSTEIDQAVRAVRFEILKVFLIALGVTVLLSIYLAGTIGRPIRRLAAAAERVRRGHGRQVLIPDFTRRGDEIGDLSGAFREMTGALWARMDAIEHFAADVAHEIKNPLTSLRSAVETAARVADPQKQRKLLAVVLEDVQRLDRLITDISDASRLDAELSRVELEPVMIGRMLEALVDVHQATADERAPRLLLSLPGPAGTPAGDLTVPGIESRLVQVFRNLIGNALSFSPPGATIHVAAERRGDQVVISIEDEGPGIPEGKLEAIFERFYSERPAGEKFGTHSGLGLSISKQIVEAHRGTIRGENRRDVDGSTIGARFTVRLPVGTP